MADFSVREYITRTVEFSVPCHGTWGACWAEIDKAFTAALARYRWAHDLPDDTKAMDDWLRVFPGDDEILIRFTVEEPSDG